MRWIEPRGEANAKVAAPLGETQPLAHEMGCAEECWLKRAAMLEPCRLLPSTDANTDGCSPPPADDNTGFWRKTHAHVDVHVYTVAVKNSVAC